MGLLKKVAAAEDIVSVADAKAGFSALLTRVQKKHRPITIVRRGIPVAQIIPLPDTPKRTLRGSMAGTAREIGDIVSPLEIEWNVGEL